MTDMVERNSDSERSWYSHQLDDGTIQSKSYNYSCTQIRKCKYTNTNSQIQIHKYKFTNTNMNTRKKQWQWEILIQSSTVESYNYSYTNTESQIHKYTNTQIHKYTNTQIQIHKYKYEHKKEAVTVRDLDTLIQSSTEKAGGVRSQWYTHQLPFNWLECIGGLRLLRWTACFTFRFLSLFSFGVWYSSADRDRCLRGEKMSK